MSKKIMRNQVLDALNTMDQAEHNKQSLAIINRVLVSAEFQNAQTIGITMSRFPEVNTRPLIEAAWQAGKRIVVPRCIHESREMDFRLIPSYNSLEIVYFDLQEPIIEETVSIDKRAIDLQVVPGAVFSDEGYRIGFGGGYYDRYLSDYEGDTLSLAFDCQRSKMVPVEQHDIPVNKIFTVEKVIYCREIRERK